MTYFEDSAYDEPEATYAGEIYTNEVADDCCCDQLVAETTASAVPTEAWYDEEPLAPEPDPFVATGSEPAAFVPEPAEVPLAPASPAVDPDVVVIGGSDFTATQTVIDAPETMVIGGSDFTATQPVIDAPETMVIGGSDFTATQPVIDAPETMVIGGGTDPIAITLAASSLADAAFDAMTPQEQLADFLGVSVEEYEASRQADEAADYDPVLDTLNTMNARESIRGINAAERNIQDVNSAGYTPGAEFDVASPFYRNRP